jgi:ATP-dependent RNA helicase RhlE
MPDAIKTLAASILTHPEYVEVTPVSSTAETIQQEIFFVDQANKYELLLHVLQDKSIASALVFTRTKHGADKVVKFLVKNHVKAEAIHGNKSQNHRQRALNNFKDRSTRVLVATDIAARGIDIDELAFVINFEVPNISETYVHRIGRTGRAGASGKAISFCDVAERPYLRDIQKLIKMEIPVHVAHPFQATKLPEEVKTLAPKVAPQLRRPSTSHSKPLHQARTDQERQSGPSEQSAKSNRRKRWFKKKKKETPNHIQ